MPYTLVSAATLGFDLVRLPAGRDVADVLLAGAGGRRGSAGAAGRRPPARGRDREQRGALAVRVRRARELAVAVPHVRDAARQAQAAGDAGSGQRPRRRPGGAARARHDRRRPDARAPAPRRRPRPRAPRRSPQLRRGHGRGRRRRAGRRRGRATGRPSVLPAAGAPRARLAAVRPRRRRRPAGRPTSGPRPPSRSSGCLGELRAARRRRPRRVARRRRRGPGASTAAGPRPCTRPRGPRTSPAAPARWPTAQLHAVQAFLDGGLRPAATAPTACGTPSPAASRASPWPTCSTRRSTGVLRRALTRLARRSDRAPRALVGTTPAFVPARSRLPHAVAGPSSRTGKVA